MNTDAWWIDVVLLALLVALLAVFYAVSRRRTRRLLDDRNGKNGGNGSDWRGIWGPYRALIRQAGFRSGAEWPSFWAWKIFFAALFPLIRAEFLLGFGVGEPFGLMSVYLAFLGFFTPDLWLVRRRRARRLRIQGALSYFLDLTVALLHSGMSLERALLRAGTHGFRERHPLADEVKIVARELELGKERDTVFTTLAARTGVSEMRVVGAAVRMGLKHGSPIEDALEAQADALRAKLRERSIRRVNRMTVLALLPVFLCGIPVFAVIIYFPAILKILDTLRMFNGQ